MNLVDMSLILSASVMVISFAMNIYSLHLQRTNLKLQRQEVREQNLEMIGLLREIRDRINKSSHVVALFKNLQKGSTF